LRVLGHRRVSVTARAGGARGLTILEVVVALAVLTLTAGMLSGAVGLLQSWRGTERVKLAGYEAAHRLIVQFNEDPESVSEARYPVEVDGFLFDYEVTESIMRIDMSAGGGRVEPTSLSLGDVREDMSLIGDALANPWRVEVRVLAREREGGYLPGDEIARLSRTYSLVSSGEDALLNRIFDLLGEELDRQ